MSKRIDGHNQRHEIENTQCASYHNIIFMIIAVTPLDVVKTRLQTQQKRMTSNKCFVYCNGLMDHLCPCPNGEFRAIKTQTTHYTGMTVRIFEAFLTVKNIAFFHTRC